MKCLLFIALTLTWTKIASIRAATDICEKCVKKEDCGMFVLMNADEQMKWSEVASCAGSQSRSTGPFNFSSNAKGDYVCCPNKSLWGSDILSKQNNSNLFSNDGDNNQEQLSKAPLLRSINNGVQNVNNPNNQIQIPNENVYPIPTVNQNPLNNVNYQNSPNIRPGYNPNPDQAIYIPLPNRPVDQNIYGNQQNGLNNQGVYDNNQQNPIGAQYPNQGNINSNPGPYYPNDNNQMNLNNDNGNLYGEVDLERQCAVHTGLLPDPRTGCCGQDMSNVDTITDLQNLLNNYAPSIQNKNNNNNWPNRPPPVYNNPNIYYGKRIKRFAFNDSDSMLNDRIAGGKETELEQFPWTVLLRLTFDYGNRRAAYNCGGSLISPKYVLTAGHCVYEKAAKLIDIEITLAEFDKRTFPRDCKASLGQKKSCIDNVLMHAENVILNKDYDDDRLYNDIALIRLRGYAPFTRFIRPICLPPINIDVADLANLPLAVAGWGRNGAYKSDIKQSTVVRLVSHSECKESYPSLANAQLCAVGRTGEDSCQGDSGGPLMMLYRGSYYVVGIVSGKRADSPCGTRVPSLYTNVFAYVPWITSVISD